MRRPTEEALQSFDIFMKEVAEERQRIYEEESEVIWLKALGLSIGTDTLDSVLKGAGFSAAAFAIGRVLPPLVGGFLGGPIGIAVGAGVATWLYNNRQNEEESRKTDLFAEQIADAYQRYQELKAYHSAYPDMVREQFDELFSELVESN